jgi:hypothetical protein
MRLAYADPPYLGYGHMYTDTTEAASREYDDIAAWERLAVQLREFDGWALSMTSGNLYDILPLFPERPRIAAWVKPFAAFKRNVRVAYTWEPVLFSPARESSKAGATPTRDHIAEPITMKRGLPGAKPERFCAWLLDALGYLPGDEVVDMFPGTGVLGRVVAAREFEAGNALELEQPPLAFPFPAHPGGEG